MKTKDCRWLEYVYRRRMTSLYLYDSWEYKATDNAR